ncbi:MAG: hypothetical protein ACI4TA_13360, partial [Acetatifactor sp.]
MRKEYYEDAKENAAFERCVDVITSLIVKYGPSLKRKWELEAMMKNICIFRLNGTASPRQRKGCP